MLTCPVCPGRTFNSPSALQQHRKTAKNHPYCQACSASFPNHNALFDHATVVHSNTCLSCRRIFTSEKGVESHWYDSPKHPKCHSCGKGFRDVAARDSHNAQLHGNKKTRKRRDRKPTSRTSTPQTHTEYSATSSPNLPAQSPTLSVTSRISDNVKTLQRMLSIAAAEGVPDDISSSSQNVAEMSYDIDSYRLKEQMKANFGGPLHDDQVLKTQLHGEGNPASSPELNDERVSPLSVEMMFPTEAKEIDQSSQNPRDDASGFAEIDFSSPLLDSSTTLSSDSNSDSSSEKGDAPGRLRFIGESSSHRGLPRLRYEPESGQVGDNTMTPRLWEKSSAFTTADYESKLMEAMRAARLALCDAAVRSGSPRRSRSNSASTSFMFSRLPTISDELEIDMEEEAERELEPLDTPPDAMETKRPAGRRKRRFSLSPSLPSIPETTLVQGIGPSSPISRDDSDSDSSQGIYEHRAGDFLFDSLSDNERSQTPMTYLTADELDFEVEVEKSSNSPSLPVLLVEDLTKLVEEISPPSTANSDFFDPSADPFELHPSATNSPMSATFPKRPRAWSLSAPEPHGEFLSPEVSRSGSKDATAGSEDGKRESPEVSGVGENDAEAEEPDEVAIKADEPPPTVIEEDLFSEPDEIMEPISQDVHIIEPDNHDVDEAQFAEEGHPLRSFISLDTLPSRRKVRDNTGLAGSSLLQQESRPKIPSSSVNGNSACEQKSPLHCRLCQVDPCRKATATFCGHIFCNECIIQEIMTKSKCPVCNAPTLLYCLFKLDLDS